ncbi:MAG: TolC family protein [Planctomycetes bacterium]|nr:TolC family protein [Planctomycetota bacterium]
MRRRVLQFACCAAMAACIWVPGCSREYYRKSADEEVYSLLRQKEEQGGEMLALGSFRVEQEPLTLEAVGEAGSTEDFFTAPPPVPPAPSEEAAEEAGPSIPEPPVPLQEASKADVEVPAGEGEPLPETPAEGAAQDELAPEPLDEAAEAGGDADVEVPAGEGESFPEAPPAEGEAQDEPPAQAGADAAAGAPGGEGDSPDEPLAPPEEEGSVSPAVAGGSPSGPAQASAASAIPGVQFKDARILRLEDALRLAFANNRDYQSNREAVYSSALSLTLARWDFAPRFFGVIGGSYDRNASGELSGGVNSNFGFNLALADGARLSINILNNLFQYFTGNRREVARTIIQGAVTQPLLRGFGRDIVQEPLIQAERNLVYQIRSFRRFRQTFAVRVTSEYYRLLQERDRVANEYNNWKSLVQNRDRAEWNAMAGRLAQLEVDQARQQELQAQDRYVAAVQRYEAVLDDFKITLGIAIGEAFAPDPRELLTLVETGVDPIDIPLPTAIETAFAMRVDLASSRDRVEDSARRIEVQADALRMQLDINADAGLASGEGGEQKPLRFNADNVEYGVGFTLDLPLDRKRERNSYVAAVIAHEREKRDNSLFEDSIRLTVRDAYRTLQREFISYPIQKRSVELAEVRVASTSELRDAGRATTRDVLESQSSLIDAQNALTGSLINYTVARLELLRDMGVLDCGDDGQLKEITYGAMIP